jgi:NAD(P)-dependent dehydrogenase (short-subunit alcohol dehydrogenase family)
VVIHYGRSAEEAEKLAEELPSAEAIHCDLIDSDGAVSMVKSLASRLPNWRALINCAAVFEPDDVTGLDWRTYRKANIINARTPTMMAQAYLSQAIAPTGKRVIQFTDQKLENPNPDFFSYSISKHAMAASVPMLAMGAGSEADRIYALAPGAILPSHDQTEEETEVSHRLNLLKRKTSATEIAEACLFLAEGQLASGQTLFIDSGQHLLNQTRDIIYLAREMVPDGARP